MGISIPEILTQAFAFILLVLVLKKFAWRPLLKLLDERREKIKSSFETIESTKRDVDALKVEYEKRREHIEEEARKRLEQALEEGRRIAREVEESARLSARAALEKAKQDIQLETEKAKVTLRNEVAELVLFAAERLIEKKMDAAKDKELALHFIKDFEQIK